MMETFLHQVVAGLATGGIYASVALALVMIYQATHHINFAQGELAMFATYICWSLINAGVPYWVAFFSTIAIAFCLGVLIERILIRPVERAPVLDLFAHSGTTALTAELQGRKCITADIDPVFCEIAIRRIERYRTTGKLGWQNSHPFERELPEMIPSGSRNGDCVPRETATQVSLFE